MSNEFKKSMGYYIMPFERQDDLYYVAKIILHHFTAEVKKSKELWKRDAYIDRVVLFGSYAKNKQQEDAFSGYYSDFDILVIVEPYQAIKEFDCWSNIEDHFTNDIANGVLQNEVAIIKHTICEINKGLEDSNYFFKELLREGVALYRHPNAGSIRHFGAISPRRRYEIASKYFERWLRESDLFYDYYHVALSKEQFAAAAFPLHQSVEKLYYSWLAVRTNYIPGSHNLRFLRNESERHDERLVEAWPRKTKKQRLPFNILKKAYYDARYSLEFKISKEQLLWLEERRNILQELMEVVCKEYLEKILQGLTDEEDEQDNKDKQ